MRTRTSVGGIVVLVGALALFAGCTMTGSGEAGDNSVRYPVEDRVDVDQDLFSHVVVESMSLPSSESDEAVFVLRNKDDKEHFGLTAQVIFCRPPEGEVQEYEAEVVEQRFSVVKGDTHRIVAKTNFAGSVGMVMLKVLPALTVAREGSLSGTQYLNGKLECIEVNSDLSASESNLSFKVENISTMPISTLLYRVLAYRGSDRLWDSDWIPLDTDLPSGGETTIEPDLGGEDLGAAGVVLLVEEL